MKRLELIALLPVLLNPLFVVVLLGPPVIIGAKRSGRFQRYSWLSILLTYTLSAYILLVVAMALSVSILDWLSANVPILSNFYSSVSSRMRNQITFVAWFGGAITLTYYLAWKLILFIIDRLISSSSLRQTAVRTTEDSLCGVYQSPLKHREHQRNHERLMDIVDNVIRLAKRINVPNRLLPSFGASCDLGGEWTPDIEVNSRGYHYIIRDERGQELNRYTTDSQNELLYRIFTKISHDMAFEFEFNIRRGEQDSRRMAFAKQIEILSQINSEWAKRMTDEMEVTLAAHPFDDGPMCNA
jgi:hypothetical protein